MDVETSASEIERALEKLGAPERAEHERRYLKSDLRHLGVSVPAIRRVAKEALAGRDEPGHDELVALVEALWRRPVHECRMTAVELLDLRSDLLEAGDLALVERLLRESRTWALVDGLAAGVAGPLVDRHPELAASLDRWATDDDFWIRRFALLANLLALRRGEGDFERYADAMLEERELLRPQGDRLGAAREHPPCVREPTRTRAERWAVEGLNL